MLEVAARVPLGTRVRIAGTEPEEPPWYGDLRKGSVGPGVVYTQSLLRRLGFYPGFCDGWYGEMTFLAVRYFQASSGLVPSGVLDAATQRLLLRRARTTTIPSYP